MKINKRFYYVAGGTDFSESLLNEIKSITTLPKLVGSEKQVKWACDIRNKMIKIITDNLTDSLGCYMHYEEIINIKVTVFILKNQISSSWYIENRPDDVYTTRNVSDKFLSERYRGLDKVNGDYLAPSYLIREILSHNGIEELDKYLVMDKKKILSNPWQCIDWIEFKK